MSVTPIRDFGDPVLRTPAELGDELESGPEGCLSLPFILFVDRLVPEHRREAMRIVREADWAGGPPPVVRVSPHADAFGRR